MAKPDDLDLSFLDEDIENAPLLYRWLQKIPVLKNIPFLIRASINLPDPRRPIGMLLYIGTPVALLIAIIMLISLLSGPEEPEYVKPVADPNAVLSGISGRDQGPQLPRDAHFERGDQYMARGEYTRAMFEYQKAIGRNAALANYNLGIVYNRLDRRDDAIEAFSQAIAARPDFPDAYSALGLALKDAGRLPEALNAQMEAARIEPDNSRHHNNIGNLHLAMGNYERAMEHLDRAIELDPVNLDAMTNRSALLMAMGRHQDAITGFREVLELDPDNYAVKNNLGIALRETGNHLEALNAFREARLIRKTPNIFVNIADTYRDMQRTEEAIHAYRSAANLSPTNFPLKKLAQYQYDLHRFKDMRETLQKIAETEPLYPRGDELHSYADFIQDSREAALARLAQNLERNSIDEPALRGLSRLRLIADDLPGALDVIQEYEGHQHRNPLARVIRAEYLRKAGAPEQARRLLAERPRNVHRDYYEGKLHMDQDSPEAALQRFERIPDGIRGLSGRARYARTMIQLAQGKPIEANQDFKQAVKDGIGLGEVEFVPSFRISDKYQHRQVYAFSPHASIAERYLEYARPLLLEADKTHQLENTALTSYEKSLYRIASRQFSRAARYTEAILLNNRGVEQCLTGNLAHALELFQMAQEQEKSDPRIRYNLALTYQKMGYDEAARPIYKELRSQVPELYEIGLNLAVMDTRRGNRDAVSLTMANLRTSIESDWRQQLQDSTDDPRAEGPVTDPRLRLLLGLADAISGDAPAPRIASTFDELVEEHPEFLEAQLFREIATGASATPSGRLDVSPRYQFLLGDRAMLADSPDRALRQYHAAWSAEPNLISASKLGLFYREQGDYRKANQFFRQAIRTRESIAGLMNLANNYSDLGQYEKLRTTYEKAIEQEDENFFLLMNYAYANQQFARYNFAREIFELASQINPSDPMPYYQLAKIHLMYDRVFMAREELRKGLEQYPNLPELNYLMALSTMIDGQFYEASVFLQRAVNNGIELRALGDIDLQYHLH